MGQAMQRRIFDVLVSGALLVLTWPVFVVCAIAVRFSGPGPILHRAIRIGQHGRPFTLYKFRTMIPGAAGAGPKITAGTDARVTSVGRLLRRSKLDELPQLWNVMAGQMSIVGPRPEDPRYVEEYTPEQRRVLDAKPGVTGPASVEYRDEESLLAAADDLDAAYAQIMADKLDIDIAYLDQRTIWSDVRLIVDTVRAVLN
ncbi:MAG: sugar transferase [Microthrixaceae bacterium]|nr:sugar transferase [Microthrixaceae bacterium]